MDMSMHTPGTGTYPMVPTHNTSHRPAPALLYTHTHTYTQPMGALSTPLALLTHLPTVQPTPAPAHN